MNIRIKYLRSIAKFNEWKDRSFTKKTRLTDNQQLAYDITKRCISHPKSLLLLAPVTNAYYIQLDDLFIKIMDSYLQIVNGKYFYHIHMPDFIMQDLDERFRHKVESKKNSIEDKIHCNTRASLTNIFKDLSDEKVTSTAINKL